MKLSKTLMKSPFLLIQLGVCLLGAVGCSSLRDDDANPPQAFQFPGDVSPTPAGSTGPSSKGRALGSNPLPVVLSPGDLVYVTFTDLPQQGQLPEHKQRVRDDGKITLPYNVTVVAGGKTLGELEAAIHQEYVPRIFQQLTATVRTEERYYYVDGEVRQPNRQLYHGKMTVLRAISTAGGFTDFANRKRVELRRTNGEKMTVNWYKAVKEPNLDPPVFPDDQIIVHKKLW